MTENEIEFILYFNYKIFRTLYYMRDVKCLFVGVSVLTDLCTNVTIMIRVNCVQMPWRNFPSFRWSPISKCI